MGNFIRRVRHLRFSMSLTEAVRMAWNERRDGSFETCPSAAAFPVVLRGGTSDIRCFEKIFVQHGYSPPRELGPFDFPLCSDFWPHGAVSQFYGVFREHGPNAGTNERAIVIVGRSGKILFSKVYVEHDLPPISETLEALRRR